MKIDNMNIIDREVAELIKAEEERQQDEICLIASENIPSIQAMDVCGSIMMAKYSEGYPNKRYYGGCINVDKLETLAINRAKELFGAEHANVQPANGSDANRMAYAALLDIGDKILSCSLQSGAHLTHSSPVSFVSKMYDVSTYEVDPETYMYDYDEIEKIALEVQPKLIICGTSAYSRLIDYARFREIADKVGAYLMCDMAHIAGLVAAKVIPSPVPYCDIVTTTTHKTLRGVRGGLILCKEQFAKAVDKSVFPQNAGGALQNMVTGKAVCFGEAMLDDYKEYQEQVLKNAKCLSNYLKERGWNILTGGTDNHLFLMDLRGTGITGKDAEKALENIGIAVNKNSIPFDTEKPTITSGIRIGTPAVTTRGMKEPEMIKIGEIIDETLIALQKANYSTPDMVEICCRVLAQRDKVKELTKAFPIQI